MKLYLDHRSEQTKQIHATLRTTLGHHLRKSGDDRPAAQRLAELVYIGTFDDTPIQEEELEELATAIHWTARGLEQGRRRCDILRSACAAAKAIPNCKRRKLVVDRKAREQHSTRHQKRNQSR